MTEGSTRMRNNLDITWDAEGGHAKVVFTSWTHRENGDLDFIRTEMDTDEARLEALKILRLADKADKA